MRLQIKEEGYVHEKRGPMITVEICENDLIDVIAGLAVLSRRAVFPQRFTAIHDDLERQLFERRDNNKEDK